MGGSGKGEDCRVVITLLSEQNKRASIETFLIKDKKLDQNKLGRKIGETTRIELYYESQ